MWEAATAKRKETRSVMGGRAECHGDFSRTRLKAKNRATAAVGQVAAAAAAPWVDDEGCGRETA